MLVLMLTQERKGGHHLLYKILVFMYHAKLHCKVLLDSHIMHVHQCIKFAMR